MRKGFFEEFCREFAKEMNGLRMEQRAGLSGAKREPRNQPGDHPHAYSPIAPAFPQPCASARAVLAAVVGGGAGSGEQLNERRGGARHAVTVDECAVRPIVKGHSGPPRLCFYAKESCDAWPLLRRSRSLAQMAYSARVTRLGDFPRATLPKTIALPDLPLTSSAGCGKTSIHSMKSESWVVGPLRLVQGGIEWMADLPESLGYADSPLTRPRIGPNAAFDN